MLHRCANYLSNIAYNNFVFVNKGLHTPTNDAPEDVKAVMTCTYPGDPDILVRIP